MIIQERFDCFIRTFSDSQKYIIQNETGAKYIEALDIEPLKYTYSESAELIEEEELYYITMEQ